VIVKVFCKPDVKSTAKKIAAADQMTCRGHEVKIANAILGWRFPSGRPHSIRRLFQVLDEVLPSNWRQNLLKSCTHPRKSSLLPTGTNCEERCVWSGQLSWSA